MVVEPFYSARTQDAAPNVGTGMPYAERLASLKREDIVSLRDMVLANPKSVSPMTMMVLAIRLFDVGLRDEAPFWFYAAKDRFRTLTEAAAPGAPQLVSATVGMTNFNTLAGAAINGYAFCDFAKQQAARAMAIAWVEAHPYEAVFVKQLPAKRVDRKAALAEAIETLKADVAKERVYFDDPENVMEFKARRKQNDADAKYCWK
jgi:hypothetical protein